MTPPHLDDEALSAHLDGAIVDPHLQSCQACSRRLVQLTSARDAVAAAHVDPLTDGVVDRLVARALAATGSADVLSADEHRDPASEATVVPADRAALRRRLMPPPAWVVTAAAAIAAVAGVAGVLRGIGADDARFAGRTLNLESSAQDARDEKSGSPTGAGMLDPEVVQADLGDQDDPLVLAALLTSRHGSATSHPEAAGAEAGDSAGSRANPPSPTSTVAPRADRDLGADRARCRAAAERLGADRLGRLVSTSLVRWRSIPAEVLVFDLIEPSGGVSRQAMVLDRSECALLADPRF